MDDGSESYLPEELLSLLDAGLRSDARGTAVIDHDAFYAAAGEGFDYVVARDIARKRADRGGMLPFNWIPACSAVLSCSCNLCSNFELQCSSYFRWFAGEMEAGRSLMTCAKTFGDIP